MKQRFSVSVSKYNNTLKRFQAAVQSVRISERPLWPLPLRKLEIELNVGSCKFFGKQLNNSTEQGERWEEQITLLSSKLQTDGSIGSVLSEENRQDLIFYTIILGFTT